jgi:hypothetical protein
MIVRQLAIANKKVLLTGEMHDRSRLCVNIGPPGKGAGAKPPPHCRVDLQQEVEAYISSQPGINSNGVTTREQLGAVPWHSLPQLTG